MADGVFHLVYTAHGGEADFCSIEPDLDMVRSGNRPLVVLFEDVVTVDYVQQRLDTSLRMLRPESLFEPSTVRKHREPLAAAYAHAVDDMNAMYRAWNALPAAQKHTVFAHPSPFNRLLLDWTSARNAELIRAETSLEAWLTLTTWHVHRHRTDAAMAKGDAATMWVEHRNEWMALARSIRLRDTDANAQITRIANVERRGHDVLYVVGALHAINEDLLVNGLGSLVHKRRIAEMASERFAAALLQNAEPPDELETLVFLHDRLQTIARPTTSIDDVARLLTVIAEAADSHQIPLRQIIDALIAMPRFQKAAPNSRRAFFALVFITALIDAGLLRQSEVEEYLSLGIS